jgi:hypothetical protein
LPGVWLLHGPEHSRKMHALQTIASKCDCRSFSPSRAAEDSFAHNERMVQEAKQACSTLSPLAVQVFCIVRVDLFEHLFQKALLPLLEQSTGESGASCSRAWILTARNLSHCIPPLRSRAQLIRCVASLVPSPDSIERRPLKESVHNLLVSRDALEAKNIILDAFLRGALAHEVLHELSLQLHPAHLERFLLACQAAPKVAQDDWLAVFLIFSSAVY